MRSARHDIPPVSIGAESMVADLIGDRSRWRKVSREVYRTVRKSLLVADRAKMERTSRYGAVWRRTRELDRRSSSGSGMVGSEGEGGIECVSISGYNGVDLEQVEHGECSREEGGVRTRKPIEWRMN